MSRLRTTIHAPSVELKRFTVVQTGLNCGFPITFTKSATVLKNGINVDTTTDWMNLVDVITGVESKLVVNNSDRTSVGIYTVTIAASIHQVLTANQTKQINFSFTSVVNGVSPGVYPISLNPTLKNFTIVTITKSYTATITCKVFSIAVNKAPATLTQF